jgi:hypothetical protein
MFIDYESDSAKRSGADQRLGHAASAPAGRARTTAIRTKEARLGQRVRVLPVVRGESVGPNH